MMYKTYVHDCDIVCSPGAGWLLDFVGAVQCRLWLRCDPCCVLGQSLVSCTGNLRFGVVGLPPGVLFCVASLARHTTYMCTTVLWPASSCVTVFVLLCSWFVLLSSPRII